MPISIPLGRTLPLQSKAGGGFRSLGVDVAAAGLLFSENFDAQPDWTSTLLTTNRSQKRRTGDVLPDNWDEIYQTTVWSPETGFPTKHATIEILASNTDKTRSGTGKSMVNWRESSSSQWGSDSQMVHLLDRQYDELYIEFYIAFSDNWWQRNNTANFLSKLFRIGSWDGVGDLVNGGAGSIGPVIFWDYKRDIYGLQNTHIFRGGPWGENYSMNTPGVEPRYSEYTTANFGSATLGKAPGGADPLVVNQIDGGFLKDIPRFTPITHEQVFGVGQHWTKVAFYVKINSAPNATDGVMRQWINDQRIANEESIPWIKANTENKMVGWNYFGLGGNDSFFPLPADQQFEDWYALDDVVVRESIPEGLV
jgi:hypothetical protein